MNIPKSIHSIYQWLTQELEVESCDVAVILGSGLGGFENQLTEKTTLPYSSIPGFPQTTVVGHSGSLSIGFIREKRVLVFSGRFHRYEGHEFAKTVIPVQLANLFNAQTLFASNAAGSINNRFNVGDLMLIDSLLAPNIKISDQTTRWFERYEPTELLKSAKKEALNMNLHLQQGTYLYVTGPCYETKAEIRAYRSIGVDAVGMSTVPELNEACRLGMNALGISLITNMATGVSKKKLNHAEVQDVAGQRTEVFRELIRRLIAKI